MNMTLSRRSFVFSALALPACLTAPKKGWRYDGDDIIVYSDCHTDENGTLWDECGNIIPVKNRPKITFCGSYTEYADNFFVDSLDGDENKIVMTGVRVVNRDVYQPK